MQQRLDEIAKGKIADNETLATLVDAIRAKPDASSVAIATQQAVGRWFVSDYVANARTWQAARDCRRRSAPRISFTPFISFFSGRCVTHSIRLADASNDDRAGIHATGIAVHNIVRGFQVMQQVWHDKKSATALVGRGGPWPLPVRP